jgi:hypothetical protein
MPLQLDHDGKWSERLVSRCRALWKRLPSRVPPLLTPPPLRLVAGWSDLLIDGSLKSGFHRALQSPRLRNSQFFKLFAELLVA